MEGKEYTYEEEEIGRVVLDWDEITEWRDAQADDIPVCSCLSFYRACGLEPIITQYSKDHDNAQIVPLDNICASYSTIQHIKNFIMDNWKTYSLDIIKDNCVVWDTKKWDKNKKHYAKKLKAKANRSVITDFYNYCPGEDIDMEDDILAFRIYHKVEKEHEEKEKNNTETIED